MQFFSEIKGKNNLCLVLLYYHSGLRLPLFTLLERAEKDGHDASVYISQNQFLKKWDIFGESLTNQHVSLSLAIVPLELLRLNSINMLYEPYAIAWEPQVFVDDLCPEQIIFSNMGNKKIPVKRLLEEGDPKVNPYYQEIIDHLIKTSPYASEPVKAIITALMPLDAHQLADSQNAYTSFISIMKGFDYQMQQDILYLLSLPLNPLAKGRIADVKQFRKDRTNRLEIDFQLYKAFGLPLPKNIKESIKGYLGANIPGFSKNSYDRGEERAAEKDKSRHTFLETPPDQKITKKISINSIPRTDSLGPSTEKNEKQLEEYKNRNYFSYKASTQPTKLGIQPHGSAPLSESKLLKDLKKYSEKLGRFETTHLSTIINLTKYVDNKLEGSRPHLHYANEIRNTKLKILADLESKYHHLFAKTKKIMAAFRSQNQHQIIAAYSDVENLQRNLKILKVFIGNSPVTREQRGALMGNIEQAILLLKQAKKWVKATYLANTLTDKKSQIASTLSSSLRGVLNPKTAPLQGILAEKDSESEKLTPPRSSIRL